MPSDVSMRLLNAVHGFVLAVTGGRLGSSLVGMPVLRLTTVGRKSGKPRTVLLTSPLQQGDTWIVVASRGGDDEHPAWLLNIRESPRVEVSMRKGEKQPWIATIANELERDRLWPLVTAKHPRYARYQRKTRRQIPLVLLQPQPSEG